ncbi:MAG: hypothetical protein CMF89_00095, partial [Candidatus Marinimicrobia bacterium]|nr:hypothetical protein [Candidatus Neomarinimicrobiota bacterium]
MFKKHSLFLPIFSVLFLSLNLNSVGVNQIPSITFSATQDKLVLGSDVTLNWSASNANFCIADGNWQGEKKISGSESIFPEDVGFLTYKLKCIGSGGEASKEISLEVYKYINGVVVDGYIRDANVFNDLNQNFIYDINEENTFTDINGSFVLKFGDVFVSLGGFDAETNNSLEDFLLFTNLDKDSDFVVISPLTSLRYFYDNKLIFNASIGIDEYLDIRNIDPIANIDNGRKFETLFEKGTQFGILAYSLQNISNHINTSDNTTELFFSLLANAIEERYTNSNKEVDIYSRDFIGSILRKLNDNLDSEISFLDTENTTTLLTGIVNNLNIKGSIEGNNALFDFATSIFQDDLKEAISGTLNSEILNKYETDILEYIAQELNIQKDLLESKYAQSNNQAPVIISSNTFYVDENTTTIGQVLVDDQDTPLSELTFEIYDGSSVIDVSSSGLLSFFNPQDYETQKAHGCRDVSPYFTYGVQVSDGVNITRQELCIYINDLDEGDPIFLSEPNFDFNKDAKYIGLVEATDPNGEYVSFSVDDARLEIQPVSSSQSITYKGILRFKEDFDQSSQGSFTSQIIASDGTHTTEQQINLITPNAAPVFTSSSVFTAPENQLSIGKVIVTDDDNDQITYSVSGSDISISANGDLSFISEPDFETQASYSATVSADDGYDVTTQDITINVENVNEPPTSFYPWNPEDKTHGFLYAHESMTKILGARWGYDDALNQPQLRVGFVDPEGDSLEAISGDDLNITKISTSENGINVFEIKLSEPLDFENSPQSGDVYETTFSITDGEFDSTFVTPITIINNPEAPILSGVYCDPERNEECYIDNGIAVFNFPENYFPIASVKFISPDGLKAYQSCNVISSDFYDDFNFGGKCPSNEDDELVLSFGLNYSSDYELKNSYSFKFEATTSDFYYSDPLTSTFDVIVNIVDEDDTAPELTTNNNFWIDENTLDIGTVTATDVDTDNSLIRFTTSSTNIEIDNITGQAVFISPPDYEQKIQYVESVTVSDGINSSTGNIEINIDNVNDNSPVLNFDAFRVDENETYVGIAEATDADGDQLTYSLSGDGADVLTINQEGELRFIEAPDFETKESYSEIVVNVSDGLNTSSRGIGILINNLNDNKPKFTSSPNFIVDEMQTYIGQLEATDADGDTVSFSTNSSQISINNLGEITFNKAPDYEQKNEFTFSVIATDGTNRAFQRITISINDLNDAPTFSSNVNYSSNENKKRVGRINTNDQDNDVIDFQVSGGSDQELFTIDSEGILFFRDSPNYENPADDNGDNSYEVQITISDQEESTSQIFYVDVIDINDPPVIYDFIPSIFNVYENGSTFSETVEGTDCMSTISVTYITCGGKVFISINGDRKNAVHDEDGDSLSYSLTGTDSQYLSVTQNSSRLGGGAIFLVNHADYEAKDSYDFILNVSDGSSSVSSSHQIQVIDIDEAPIVSSSTSISLNENISDVIAIQAEDPEGKSIVFSLGQSNEGDSSRFEITPDGQLSLKELYTNFEDYPTSVAYVYISDDNNSRSPTVFTVNLQDINDAPVINDNFPSVFEVNENATTTFYSQSTACISKADRIYLSCSNVSIHLGDGATQDTVSDEDGDGLSYSITGQDADKFGVSAAGSIYMKAPGNFEEQSSYSFILNVSDGDIVTSKESIVVFKDINEPPVFTGSSSFTIEENETTVGLITAEDPEGDWAEFIMGSVHDGDSGSFTIDSNGSLAFRSAPDFETKNSFTAHLFVTDPDGSASFTSTVITIDVTNVNDNSPTFTSTNEFSVDENISLIGTVEAIDIDGDDFTFSTTSSDVAIDEITGEMVFISSPDYETQSSYSVEVVASDGLLSETQTIAININDTNDVSPTITSTSFIVDENESSIGSLTLSDPDTVNSFTYSIDSSDISIDSSGNLTFNSAPDYETTTSYTATVTVNDGENTTSESISISIIDLDDEIPVITSSLNYFVNEDTTLIGTITASDDDAGSTLTFSLDSVMDGIISIDASTGVLSFDEAKDYESSGDGKVWGIQVYVSDGTNSSDEHIHIHLNNNNDNDHEFIGQNLTVDENDNEVGTIFFTDRDIGSRVDYCLPEDSVLVFQSSSSRCSTTGYAGSGITWSHSDTILTLSTYDYESDSSFSTIITAEDYNTNDEEPLTIKTQVHNINVTIVDVDEAPVFTNSTQISIDENETTVTQIVATDDDGDAITYSLYGSDSQYFTIDANTGDLSLRSAADYESRDSYTSMIVIADSGTNSSNLDLDVFINDVNEPPVFTSSRSFSVMENRNNYYDVFTTAEDPEGEQVFYRLLYGVGSDAEKLQIDRTSGGVRARPCIYDRTNDGSCYAGSSSSYFDFEAQSELNFQVVAYTETDQYLQDASSEGTSATESFQINVLDEEETFYYLLNGLYLESYPPSLYVDENESFIGTFQTIPIDSWGSTNTWIPTSSLSNDWFDYDQSTGFLSFKDNVNIDYESQSRDYYTATFNTIKSNDRNGDTYFASISIDIYINDVNEAPTLTSSILNVDENQTAIGSAPFTDQDGDSLSFSISGGADQNSINIGSSSGTLVFVDAPNYEEKNAYEIEITVSDGSETVTENITININDVNEAPAITSSANFTVSERSSFIGTVTATDEDPNDTISFSLEGSGSNTNNAFIQDDYGDLDETDFYELDVDLTTQDVKLRIFNNDDYFNVSIKDENDVQQYSNQFGSEYFIIDVDQYVSTVGATIDLELINCEESCAGYSLGWELIVDNNVVFTNSCSSCANDSYSTGIVYQSSIYLGPTGEGISVDSSTGVLTFDAGADYETTTTYQATVIASDGELSDSQDITVTVANVDGISKINEIYLCSFEETQDNYCATNSVLAASNDGSIFVVGMPNIDTVKVFKKTSGTWSQHGADITGVSASSVDISGDGTRIIFSYDGIIAVKEYDSTLSDWIDVGSALTNPGSGWTGWGSSVAIDEDGDTIVIGAGNANVPDLYSIGAIKIFNYDQSSSDWVEISSYGSNVSNWMRGWCEDNYCTGAGIGYDVDINNAGDVVIASGPTGGFGQARVFYKLSNTWYMRCYQGGTGNGDGCNSINDKFMYPGYNKAGGFSSAIKGDSTIDDIVVTLGGPSDNAATDFSQGDPIHARTWKWNPGYNNSYNWEPHSPDITRARDRDHTGYDVSLSDDGSVLAVSAPRTYTNENYRNADDINDTDSGAVTIYSLSNMVTTEIESVSFDSNYQQQCGHSIDVNGNGDFLFFTCPGYSDYPADNRGRVLIYSVEIDDVSDGLPSFTSDASFYVNENETSIGTVTATDSDGDTLEFSVSHDDIQIDTYTGELTFSSPKDYETDADTYTATIFVTDGTTYSSQDITVYLTNVNDNAPAISSADTFTVIENETSIGTVSASDADGNSITFSISSSDISIDSTSGVMTFNSAPDYDDGDTAYSATITVSDGSNDSTQEISITISDVDDTAPVFTSDSNFSVDENETTIGTLTATDIDTDDIFITFSTSSSDISVDAGSGVMTFNSAPDYETQSSYTLIVNASDGTNSTSQEITVNINNLNDNAPSFSTTSISVDEHELTIGQVPVTDADGDTLTYEISNISGDGADYILELDSQTGILSFVQEIDYECSSFYSSCFALNWSADITVSDGDNSITETFSITVVNINDNAPTLSCNALSSNGGRQVYENQSMAANCSYSDIDNDSVIFSINSTTLQIDQAGVVTGINDFDRETERYHYGRVQITDTDGKYSDSVDIMISVLDQNDNAHTITSPDSFTINENEQTIGTLTVDDADWDRNYTITSSSSDIEISGYSILLTEIPDYDSGDTSFTTTITVSDSNYSDSQTITVNINDIDEPPILNYYALRYPQSPSALPENKNFIYGSGSWHGNLSFREEVVGTFGLISATDPEGEDVIYSIEKICYRDGDFQVGSPYNGGDTNTVISCNEVSDDDIEISIDETTGEFLTTISDIDSIYDKKSRNGNLELLMVIDICTTSGVCRSSTDLDYGTYGSNTYTPFIWLTITGWNDSSPIFDSTTLNVDENETVIGTISITDPDDAGVEDPDALTVPIFSITGGDDDVISIDSSTGVLTFTSTPDYENTFERSFSITVEVADADINDWPYEANTTEEVVTILVNDINDNDPYIANGTNYQGLVFTTGNENEIDVLQIAAYDADPTDTILYCINTSSTSTFNITDSGMLQFKEMLDYENSSSSCNSYSSSACWTVIVAVGNDTCNANRHIYPGDDTIRNVQVYFGDLNDNDPVISSSDSFSVDENETSIGTV